MQYKLKDSHYITSSEDVADLLESFLAQQYFQLFFVHLDLKMSHEVSLASLLGGLFSGGLELDAVSVSIVLSPIVDCEEKDFNPPVEEESIVASIIPRQTFKFYMFGQVDVDFSKCSVLIQYDKGVTRKFGEFDSLQDVLQFTQQRQANYGVLKSKTFLGDNFMMDVAFKLKTIGKFGA